MKLPYFRAIDKETHSSVEGFYFEYPETTWSSKEDYEKNDCPIIHCIINYEMSDYNLPNFVKLYKIDIATLQKIGEVEVGCEFLKNIDNYIKLTEPPCKYKIGDRVNTVAGAAKIVGIPPIGNTFYRVRLTKWTDTDIDRMGGLDEAWILLDSETQFID